MLNFKKAASTATRTMAATATAFGIAATPLAVAPAQAQSVVLAVAKICGDWNEINCSIVFNSVTSINAYAIACALNGNVPVLVGPPGALAFKRCALPVP